MDCARGTDTATRYHDHGLDITSTNVYGGMYGMWFVEEPCPPFNLASMPRLPMILADKLLDADCQLAIDIEVSRKSDDYHRVVAWMHGV